jgi:hypothetical protein
LFQLPDTLLLGRQWLSYAWLARLLSIELLQPTAYGGWTNVHALANMLNTESLFFDHFDDLKLEAWIKITALPCHANLLGWWIVHLSRCPGKLDHYRRLSLVIGWGLAVVAEGAETAEEWALLVELGCDYVQGYFVARPRGCDAGLSARSGYSIELAGGGPKSFSPDEPGSAQTTTRLSSPMYGIKNIHTHQPDMLRSCSRFVAVAKACSGQVNSDTTIGFFAAMFRS